VLASYLEVFEKTKLHTCDPVSMLSSIDPSKVFQNFIVRSADPPPEARTP